MKVCQYNMLNFLYLWYHYMPILLQRVSHLNLYIYTRWCSLGRTSTQVPCSSYRDYRVSMQLEKKVIRVLKAKLLCQIPIVQIAYRISVIFSTGIYIILLLLSITNCRKFYFSGFTMYDHTVQSHFVNINCYCPPQASSMMEPCVTPAVNSPSLVFAGNVLSAPIMTSVQPVTMETSITWDTGSTGSPPQAVRGWLTQQHLPL